MALVTGTTLPNDGDRIVVANYNSPIQAILAQFNGNIDSANIASGSMPWEIMASFTNKIPAAAMQDEANTKKFRDESNVSFVASGCIWSATSGLSAAMTSGVLYVANGARLAISAIVTRAFTASRDTYVDFSSAGAVGYSEVTNGAAAPALAADSIRVAKVVTNGSAVTSVVQVGIDSLGNYIYNTDPTAPPVTVYTNPGTVGGTFYYTDKGGIKRFWGRTGTVSIVAAGFGSTTGTITLPVGLFNTLLSIQATSTSFGSTQYQSVGVNTFNATTIDLYFLQFNGNNGTSQALISLQGT